MSTKPKGERLKETITLLKKLPQVGVPVESYAYSQVGPAAVEIIDFDTHWGELTLPVKEGKVSTLELKLKKK
jgi:hypothetical protein